ncbi:IMP dehydrogenase [Candidatus Microgenomates bacterium]|nr:IMP dehydrogenase [Candidatus Microgenomates bacterium]
MKEGLSFDDVLLLPQYSDLRSKDIDLMTYLTPQIKLKIPLISSPMDTVTESELAIALAKEGGISIIHRNLSIKKQAEEVKKVKGTGCSVGAAIGAGKDIEERTKALVNSKVDVLVIDSAHGYSQFIINVTSWVKKNFPQIPLISGNVATSEGALALIKAGANALRVGLGPGSICITRVITGMGMPQLTAILDCGKLAKKYNVPIIADGGIRTSGDIVKALAAGASTVMIGSLFASCKEAPGKVVTINGKKYKSYRGMGSIAALKAGGAARYGQKYKKGEKKKLIAEGVESLVPFKGTISDFVYQLIGGVKRGMVYIGAKNISELQKKAKFIKITNNGLQESHPHDVLITETGGNYEKF